MIKTHVAIDVFDYSDKKLCNIYDNALNAEGQAFDIIYENEINGSQTLSFVLPYVIDGRKNFRWDYIRAEFLVRLTIGDKKEWFVIDAPTKKKNNKTINKDVTCSHISTILKTKNLYKTFDDENGIGTLPYLMEEILKGTLWSFDDVNSDTFLENDGETEKVRSLMSDGKDGAYQLIADVCGLFDAYPVFDGDTKKVACYSMNHKGAMREMSIGKDIDALDVKFDSSSLITRMYVEGNYGEDEYLGIDTVNPTGLSYLMDFSYYKELGLFTNEHQAALDQYYEDIREANETIATVYTNLITDYYMLSQLWGETPLVYYPVVNGELDTDNYILNAEAEPKDAIPEQWDSSEEYKYGDVVQYGDYEYQAKTTIIPGANPTDTRYWNKLTRLYVILQGNDEYRQDDKLGQLEATDTGVVKFILLPSGMIGAKQVTVESKTELKNEIQKDLTREQSMPNPDLDKIAAYQSQMVTLQNGIDEMYTGVGVVNLGILRTGGFDAQGQETDKAYAKRTDVLTVAHDIPYVIHADDDYKLTMFCFDDTATMIGTFVASDGETVTINANEMQDEDDNPILRATNYYRVELASLDETTVPADNKGSIKTYQDTGLYNLMNLAVETLIRISGEIDQREQALNDQDVIEATFAQAMGDMLKEGYWNNTNYVEGQEQALYNDAVEMMSQMSKPTVSYSVNRVSLTNQLGYNDDDLKLNMQVHLYDRELGVNDIVYISRITKHLDDESKDDVELSNKDINLQGLSLDSVLSRMSQLADLIDQKNAIYKRSEAITQEGSVLVDRLEGQINILSNKLISSKSSWYTDENGNIIFESTNGKSAMMLTGDGFMIANGKKSDGTWNWRSFGTGEGFTADAITTGFLSADRIEARTISAAKVNDTFGAEINLSQNGAITSLVSQIENLEDQITVSSTAPTNPTVDQLWMDTSDPENNVIYRWDGTSWVETTLSQSDIISMNQAIASSQSSISQLSNEVATKVSTTQYNTDIATKADTGWVSQQLTSLQVQTATDITNIFNQSTDYVDSALGDYEQLKNDVYSWQKFSANGLEIGKSDSEFKTKLSNTKLAFTQNDDEVAYISDSSMYITNARVTNTLSVGTETEGWFDWVMTSSGLAMKWKA